MADRLGKMLFGLLFFGLLPLMSCSPAATTKPDEASSPAPRAEATKVAPDAGKGVRESTVPSGKPSTPPSSLEAQRRGEPTATPASSLLKEIYFDFDKYDLRGDARDTLKGNADWLKTNPSIRVEIEGHCDDRGTNEYNLALGAKRAQAAKDYLVTLGISAERLSTISYGEELPVCKEPTEECWQKNRRDRFVIITARPAS